jgi:uncharacterized membrane protein YheB (UPF0754 family)
MAPKPLNLDAMTLNVQHIDWMTVRLMLIPFVGAFIGWITNYVAVKMLFYPRKPVKVLFVTFHGIFPKNKDRIANKLGAVVQRDLINFNDIKAKLKDPNALANFKEEIAERVDNALRERLEKMGIAKGIVPEPLIQAVHKTIVKEIELNLPSLIDNSFSKIEQKFDIHQIVVEKVQNFSEERLEQLLMDITSKEFKFIEIIGAVLGFIIGLIQLIMSGALF